MAVKFDLPTDIEQRLRRELGDLDHAAKEAALVELYRQQSLTQPQLAHALGLSRDQTDALLKRHGVTEDLLTPAELRDELDFLDRRGET
jgi:hypothetical protein